MKAKIIALMAAGLLVLTGVSYAQGTSTGPGPGPVDSVGQYGPVNEDIQGLIEQFRAQRQELLQARIRLMEQLRTCTEEQRAQLIAQFRQQYATTLRAQAQLRKEIRRALMELRRERRQARVNSGG